MELKSIRTPVRTDKSGASVFRVQREDGVEWFEKLGAPGEISDEVAVLNWCRSRLPVPQLLRSAPGFVAMSALPGVNLTEVSIDRAVAVLSDTLRMIHSLPVGDCEFEASWALRLEQGRRRAMAGLVDDADFDDANRGRSTRDILSELDSMPLPPDAACFTHGDACLPNFLTDGERLTGFVDLGRAGVAHPAQDWALALRSMRDNLGVEAEQKLRECLPARCADEGLLRQFRLLDELF